VTVGLGENTPHDNDALHSMLNMFSSTPGNFISNPGNFSSNPWK
jgi:hypothetical protein